ncbi:MAG: hypothetical protein R3C58_13890 [Parvularculaceae bacterium]
MIVRTWAGRTALKDGEAYERFMTERAAPDYRSIEGLKKLYFTRRDEGDVAHFLLITIWESIEPCAFAGADPSKAKYYPEDDLYLLEGCALAQSSPLLRGLTRGERDKPSVAGELRRDGEHCFNDEFRNGVRRAVIGDAAVIEDY